MLWFRNLRIVLCFVIFSRGILWSEPERFGLSIIREDGKGALPYDVASLLYDAIVVIPDEQREELLDGYICGLQACRTVEPGLFRHVFYRFVLVRLLQAMGAFGLRGLYERKPHFIDSIQPGLHSIDRLFQSGRLDADYAEIRRVCRQLLE